MDDQDGYTYDKWMWLLTAAIDHVLRDEHVDLDYQDNRGLRNKELDYLSSEWERIKFFDQHLPNVVDLTNTANHFIQNIPLFKRGQRREFRLAVNHQETVSAWLSSSNKKFNKEDLDYILGRELYLAEQYFENDDKFDLYSDMDYLTYKKFRLKEIFSRFLKDYPDFYQTYEIKKGQFT
ncbi:hypothetical protein ACFQ4L_01615 [Lapidilactobacillus mulanensis]|uniref:Uncharacterized protein n=2 Tax=Lactobacillaceae TaxID=33958 RepID=A0ABW4DLU5_9LACO|nr:MULTISPECIES: hypothetical protein [Lactobacillaceae]